MAKVTVPSGSWRMSILCVLALVQSNDLPAGEWVLLSHIKWRMQCIDFYCLVYMFIWT